MKIFAALFGRTISGTPSARAQLEHWAINAPAQRQAERATEYPELLALATHSDGYVREAAVARCVALARPDLLPIVVGRLNDWVPVIRRQARMAVLTLLPFVPSREVIAALPSIMRLREARREDHTDYIHSFEEAVVAQVPVQDLLETARGTDLHLARTCFQLLRSRGLVDAATLIDIAAGSKDDIVLAREAVALSTGLDDARRTASYMRAVHSQFGAVRVLAIRALLQDPATPDRLAIAVGALMDAQPAVRAAAMWFANQAGYDAASHYRAVIGSEASGRGLRNALVSLAACAQAADAELLHGWTGSPIAAVRVLAYGGWLRVQPAEKDNIAALALQDPSPRVRRFAVQAVVRNKAYLPKTVIRAALDRTYDVNLLPLLWSGNVWEWLSACAVLAVQGALPPARRPALAADLTHRIESPDGRYALPTQEQLHYLRSSPVQDALAALLAEHPRAWNALKAELASVRAAPP